MADLLRDFGAQLHETQAAICSRPLLAASSDSPYKTHLARDPASARMESALRTTRVENLASALLISAIRPSVLFDSARFGALRLGPRDLD